MKKIVHTLQKYIILMAGGMMLSSMPVWAEILAQNELDPVVDQRRDVQVRQLSAIEFGTFAADMGGGAITVSPVGARSFSGRVTPLHSGFYGAAEYEINGNPKETVIISLPERVMLSANAGNGGASITQLTIAPDHVVILDERGVARVRVGGTLQVPGHVIPGAYNGNFNIDVRYLH